MGTEAAAKLAYAGYRVLGYRRSSMEDFTRRGGEAMPDAASLAAQSDIVILLLPTDAALMETMAAIESSLSQAKILLCLSTNPATVRREAAAIAAGRGAIMLEGAISGTPAMLQAGQASVMIAGDPQAAERCQPMLRAFAESVTCLPSFGDANNLKLLTNSLVGLHTLAAAETVLMAKRLGLDPVQAVQVIAHSAGGSTMLRVRGSMMAEGSIGPGDLRGFLRFYELLRQALKSDDSGFRPLTALSEAVFRQWVDDGGGSTDIAGIHDYLAERTGEVPTV